VRRLVLAIAAVTVVGSFVAACGDDDGGDGTLNGAPEELVGDWSGGLKQTGLPSFRVAVRFDQGGLDGRPPAVAYTGIECGGTWTWEGTGESNPPTYVFEEEIDQGSGGECKGSGRVEIHPAEPCRKPAANECDYRRLRYRFSGGGVTSTGVLTPASDDELGRIFEEAGVDLDE